MLHFKVPGHEKDAGPDSVFDVVVVDVLLGHPDQVLDELCAGEVVAHEAAVFFQLVSGLEDLEEFKKSSKVQKWNNDH